MNKFRETHYCVKVDGRMSESRKVGRKLFTFLKMKSSFVVKFTLLLYFTFYFSVCRVAIALVVKSKSIVKLNSVNQEITAYTERAGRNIMHC